MEKHAGGYIGNVPLCNGTQSEWKRSEGTLRNSTLVEYELSIGCGLD